MTETTAVAASSLYEVSDTAIEASPAEARAFSAALSSPFASADVAGVQEICPERSRWWTADRSLQATLIAAAAFAIGISVLVRRIDHDEGQYVAAIELARHGWPYIDFAYLQTPLQPILLAPLGVLPAGWLLVGARVANGVMGLFTIFLLMKALLGQVSNRSIAISIAALVCSEPFLLASSLARNDALPMALLAGAILFLLRGLTAERRPLCFGIAGLLLGLATSAKINASFPAAAAGLFLLLRRERFGFASLVAFTASAFAGLLPTLVLAAVAPSQFFFDNFVYNIDAPRQWWSAVGHAQWLEPRYRIPILAGLAAQGAALVGMIAAAIDRQRSDERLLLNLMIIGALVSAYLPVPAFVQYLVPLLPPAAIRFALAIETLPRERRRLVLILTSVCCMFGLVRTGSFFVRTADRSDDLLHAVTQGREISAAAEGRAIVTLSPERVAGSDTSLDREFVTGPFLFRTSDGLAREALRFGYSPNWQRADEALDRIRPAVIVTGGEAKAHLPYFPAGLDGAIIPWARSHGYNRVLLSGGLVLWQRP